jgi:hypothetical protein
VPRAKEGACLAHRANAASDSGSAVAASLARCRGQGEPSRANARHVGAAYCLPRVDYVSTQQNHVSSRALSRRSSESTPTVPSAEGAECWRDFTASGKFAATNRRDLPRDLRLRRHLACKRVMSPPGIKDACARTYQHRGAAHKRDDDGHQNEHLGHHLVGVARGCWPVLFFCGCHFLFLRRGTRSSLIPQPLRLPQATYARRLRVVAARRGDVHVGRELQATAHVCHQLERKQMPRNSFPTA